MEKSTKKIFPIAVLSDHLQSPDNVGTLFRTAESFGVEKIVLGAESPSPKIKTIRRISRSATEMVPYELCDNLTEAILKFKQSGYRLVALELTPKAKPIQHFVCNPSQKVLLVIGTERRGISDELLQCCDEEVYIPMYGQNHSMNVINALAIALYHVTNQMT